MGRKKRSYMDDSATSELINYGEYLMRLTELALSMFEWKNLPKMVDPRFLELVLFSDGQAVFFFDEYLGDYVALKVTANGALDIYGIPTERRAYAVNGYNNLLNASNSVMIYNNYLHTNSEDISRIYASRLREIDNIIMVNVKAQKTPVLLQATDQQKLTLLNVYKAYEGNEPVIFGDKNLDINAIKSITTNAPYVADKLYQLKNQIWNEALTFLGISNLNIQKKERLVSDEVVRSMGGTIASRYSRLAMRRQACEQINEMFGLNIEVDYRADFREADDEVMLDGATGEEETAVMVTDLRTA